MRLLVLSRNASLYSTARLSRAARARRHRVDVVDPYDLQIAVGPGGVDLCYRGEPLPGYDAVVPRVGPSATRYGVSVLAQLEQASIPVVNGAAAIAASRDKLGSLESLTRAGIPVPPTVTLRSPDGVGEALDRLGGCPVVVKLQQGAQGVGVMLASSKKALIPLVDTFLAMGQQVVLQAYVRAGGGRDLRALVVGRRVVAAMRRKAPRGEFRANMHRGAKGESVELGDDDRRRALRAARTIGLDVAGVDMIEAEDGPVVLEVNASPGLEGIEQVTDVDVARAIVELAERRAGAARR